MSWCFRQHAGGAGSITLWGFAPGVRQGGAASRWERRSLPCPGALGALLRSLKEGKKPCVLIGPEHRVASYPRCCNRAFTLPSLRDLHQFQANDTIWYASGTIEEDNVFTWSSRQKAISIAFFFIKHNNDEVTERLYCSRAKTHYSCQTSEYKRNYKMAFCTRSPQI